MMLIRETRRFIRKNVPLAISAICVLSIGLGASALVFTCLLALTTPALPGMRMMSYATIAEAAQGGSAERIAWRRYERIHASMESATHLAAYSRAINLQAHVADKDMNVHFASVSKGFWGVFTPSLATGRDFYSNEEMHCQPRVLILSYQSAARIFTFPSSAIGQVMTLNGQAYEIIGVGPPSFTGIFDQPIDGWVPPSCLLTLNFGNDAAQEDPHIWQKIAWFYAIAGEKALSSASFVKELEEMLPSIEHADAPLHVSAGLTLDPVRNERLLHWLRLGYLFTLAFTLMSGMNYAILLLAQTPSQIDDIQLKKALGASPKRILFELAAGPLMVVAMSMLSAWVICLGGLALLPYLFTAIKGILAASWPDALAACGVITIFSVLLTGLIAFIPAIGILRRSQGSLTSKYTATARASTVLLLDAIVTMQIVLCAVMAVIAGMVTASAVHLLQTPLGFETARRSVIALGPRDTTSSLSVSIDTANPAHSSFPSGLAIREILRQLESLPGIRDVGYSENVPLQEPLSSVSVRLANGTTKTYTAATSIVTQGFFAAMGIHILQGEIFPKDESIVTNQVVISRTLAAELSLQGKSVGKTMQIINPAASGLPSFTETATIIGVVDDVKQNGPASSAEPTLYQCAFGQHFFHSAPYFVVNGVEPQNIPKHDIERSVIAFIPGLAVQDVFSLRGQVHRAMIPEEERAGSVMALAILISSLAFLGLGGSLSFYIATRRRNLAIRICFGATAWDIRALVIKRAAVCGGIAALLSMLTWPFLAQLSSSNYLGSISWSYSRALAYSLLCFIFVIALSLIPANAATRTSPSELLKDY